MDCEHSRLRRSLQKKKRKIKERQEKEASKGYALETAQKMIFSQRNVTRNRAAVEVKENEKKKEKKPKP